MLLEAQNFHKKLEIPKITAKTFSGTAYCYEHDFWNRKFQTLEKKKQKTTMGPMLGQDRLQKN